MTYFDSFGIELIPKEIIKFIWNKNIITNIFRKYAYNSIVWGYLCTGFIDSVLKDNILADFTKQTYLATKFERQSNSELFFGTKYKHE